jgi:hypothetical protein
MPFDDANAGYLLQNSLLPVHNGEPERSLLARIVSYEHLYSTYQQNVAALWMFEGD